MQYSLIFDIQYNYDFLHYILLVSKSFSSFSDLTIIWPLRATNMKEKVVKGWILGKDGRHRVNHKWKNLEETFPKNPLKGVVNMKKEEVGLIKREGVGLVEIEKPAVEKELEKRAGLSVEVRPSVKTNIFGLLGPRGLRKKNGNNHGVCLHLIILWIIKMWKDGQ